MHPRVMNRWTVLGAVLAGLAVATAAIAAHGIETYLADSYEGQTRELVGLQVHAAQKHLADFKTASQYQLFHALGLIAVGLLAGIPRRRTLTAAGWLLLLGILLFCGSVYWLSLFSHLMEDEARRKVGLMAATGGVSFIAGWFCLAAAVCPCGSTSEPTSE